METIVGIVRDFNKKYYNGDEIGYILAQLDKACSKDYLEYGKPERNPYLIGKYRGSGLLEVPSDWNVRIYRTNDSQTFSITSMDNRILQALVEGQYFALDSLCAGGPKPHWKRSA